MKLFIALSALLGYYIYDLDAVNAYAQGGRPYDDCYLIVDDAFREWYKIHLGVTIPPGHVVPILTPWQGHPDAGEVWQTKVNSVLQRFEFKSTTHEPCLYRGKYKGHDILLCRQVDDMLIAGANRNVLRSFAEEIGKHLHVKIGDGPSVHYNGLDITQTREGIKIHCSTYIKKLAKAHGWESTSGKPLEPIHPDAVKELESTRGPSIDSNEGIALTKKNGFNYRSVVGEIVYAYVLCCPDFGYAVTLLSQFNTCPARCHYNTAKRCLKSLLRSPDEGIWYWRRTPLLDLTPSTHTPCPVEDFELNFPVLDDPFLASATVDASFGPNLLCWRSIGGSFIYLGLLCLISYVGKAITTIYDGFHMCC
jgi:Reverse transcriptase (RNA-dependent DNA polymerase).